MGTGKTLETGDPMPSSRSGLPSLGWPAICYGVLSLLAAMLVAWGVLVIRNDHAGWLADITVYRKAAEIMLSGGSPYGIMFPPSDLPFFYPPFAGILLAPIVWTDPIPLIFAWNTAGLLFLQATLWHWLKLNGVSGTRRAVVALLVTLVAPLLDPIDISLVLGQVNFFLLWLVVFDLSRADHSRGKGVLIGLAAGIKLIPGVFIVYLLVTRRLRAAVVATGTFLATVAVSFAVTPNVAGHFWGNVVHFTGQIGEGAVGPHSQSLNSVLLRAAHGAAYAVPLYVGLAVLLVACTVGVCLWAVRRGNEELGILCWGLVTIAVLPVAWGHYWVWAVPAIVTIGIAALRIHSWYWALVGLLSVMFCARLYELIPYEQVLQLGLPLIIAGSLYLLASLLFVAFTVHYLRSTAYTVEYPSGSRGG